MAGSADIETTSELRLRYDASGLVPAIATDARTGQALMLAYMNAAAVERTLDRASLREFDNRVLFQMSASDSSNLIDSPLANKLGANRALAYSEEHPTPTIDPQQDLAMLPCSSGTTGMPKGVLWRSADIFVRGMGGVTWGSNEEFASMEAVLERAQAHGTLIGEEMRSFSIPPLMHAGAQWSSFLLLAQGQLIIFQDNPRRLDPEEILAIVERERVNYLQIIGDAFARPILDAMGRGVYDLSTLKVISSGGAPLSSNYKEEFLERLPGVLIVDGFGASETGTQGVNLATRDSGASTGDFRPVNTTLVLSDDLIRPLGPGEPEIGWLAQCGRVPLGYLGDAAKSARTFPTIDGVRYAVPGDRARYRSDGSIEILLQHDEPAEGASNWIPIPAGPFHLILRLYLPQKAILDGTWKPPPVEVVTG